MKRLLLTRAAALAAAAVLTVAWFAPARADAQDLPVLTQPVNDLAGVIDPNDAAAMDRMIRSLQTATSDSVIVASVKTFAPFGSIEEYAVKLYERAGIGAKGQDNGVLILVAVDDRRARIEVGYGLEGFLTDGYCGDVIRTSMLPAFRRSAYGEGLLAATTQIVARIARERHVTIADLPQPPPSQRARRDGTAFAIVKLVVMVLVILFVIIGRTSRGGRGGSGRGGGGSALLGFLIGQALSNSGRRGGGWNGGGFGGGGFGGGGGGFGGFGGGRSGGGGASGGW